MRTCIACGSAQVDPDWACAACGTTPERRDGVVLLAPEAVEAGEGFDPVSFDPLVAAEEASFWFHGRNALILWAMRRYFPSAQSLLEIGCGNGFVLRGIRAAHPAMRLAGAELYPQGLVHARRRVPDAEMLQLDATRMPYDGEWDLAGAFDVLEHIRDDVAAMAGMRDAVRPGGGLLITVPQHAWLWSGDDDWAKHERRYDRADLVAKVEGVGLEVLRVTSFVSFLLPAMFVSRMLARRGGEDYDPIGEHDASARVPGLGRILAAERALIRRGVDLPAGGSLLLVARRPG